MRIIGYIEDDLMKITLLEMNHRISVKFEMEMMEQTYKLRIEPNQERLVQLKLKVKEIRDQVISKFQEMKVISLTMSKVDGISHNTTFPEII